MHLINVIYIIFVSQILDTQAKEVLKFDLTLFNDNTEGERYSDMSAVDIKVGVVLGQIRVVFVNKFVTDMLVSYTVKFLNF